MIKMNLATTIEDFKIIARLAQVIWHEHYPGILSLEQITYMLEKFNSVSVIDKQIKGGSSFFYVSHTDTGMPIAYTAIKEKTDALFLEKLYVLKVYRGQKIAKAIMANLEDYAIKIGKSQIKLHVNKLNVNAIEAYKKMGFVQTKSMITDIGNGFVMDDYEMVRILDY